MTDPAVLALLEEAFSLNGWEFNLDLLRSPSREHSLVNARRLACVVLRENGYSLQYIGKLLNRHHATVIHLVEKRLGRKKYRSKERFDQPEITIPRSTITRKALLAQKRNLEEKIRKLNEQIRNLQPA